MSSLRWGTTCSGTSPPEEDRQRRFNDFYINSQRSVDREIARLLDELDALGLTENTIVVFTSDHGEMAGSHGLHGKGPFAYLESIHLPFDLVHPDVKGGQECHTLTGHIDFVPTLLAMAGVSPSQSGELTGRTLPGKDMAPILTKPGAADTDALRDGVLFT